MFGKHAGDDVDGDIIPLGRLDFPDRTRTCHADLQYLPSSSTAKSMVDVYNTQLQSIGISPLRARVDGAKSGVRVMVMVTDDGPDEKGCERLIKTELRDDQTTLFFRIRCFLHQIHLIVSKQLKRIPRYLLVFELNRFSEDMHFFFCYIDRPINFKHDNKIQDGPMRDTFSLGRLDMYSNAKACFCWP